MPNINLSIQTPCSESFEQFDSTTAGGYCHSCQKEVIDFTGMTDDQILHYFANRGGKTCGLFRPTQLKTYEAIIPPKYRWYTRLMGASLLGFSLLTFLPISSSQAQVRTSYISPEADTSEETPDKQSRRTKRQSEGITLQGTVYGEDKQPLAGAIVVIKGTQIGTITDRTGKFKLTDVQPGAELYVSFIGYVREEYQVPEVDATDVNIVLDVELKLYVCVTVGEVAVNEVYASRRGFWQKVKGIFK